MRLSIYTTHLLAVFLLSGCLSESRPRDSSRVQTTDSAGVRVVENAVAPSDLPRSWVVSDAPVIEIGLGRNADDELFRVAGALRLSDGRILVANAGTAEIRVYDVSGAFVEAWGREGEGPGEFTALSTIHRWRADSIAAWDRSHDRLTFFDSHGRVGRTESILFSAGQPSAFPVAVLADTLILGSSQVRFTAGEHDSGLARPSRTYALFDAEGQVAIELGQHPGREYYVATREGFFTAFSHPFGRYAVATTWGDRIVISPNDSYELSVYDRTGELDMIVRRQWDPIPVTTSDIDRWVAERVQAEEDAGRPQVAVLYQDLPTVPYQPAFTRTVPDPLGYLWVSDYSSAADATTTWWVYDQAGRAVDAVETPAGLQVFEIGVDYVLGEMVTELDVETVQVWSLAR